MWLDPKARPLRWLRGLLVLHCVWAGRPGYVVEIERRSDESGQGTENFSGFVFVLRSERELDPWLRRLLSSLRDTCGIFDSFLGRCPARVTPFKHPDVPPLTHSQAGARNALSKL